MMAYKMATTFKSVFYFVIFITFPGKAFFSFTKIYVVSVIIIDADIIFMLLQP